MIMAIVLMILQLFSVSRLDNSLINNTSDDIKNPPWIEAYSDVISEYYPSYFTLLDFDFDGIPELFFIISGYGPNMWVTDIIKYTDDGIVQLDVFKDELEIPIIIQLYRDTQTGETRWMTEMDPFRSSYSRYTYDWEWIDFTNFPNISMEFFFGWDYEFFDDESDDTFDERYYLHDNKHDFREVDYDEIGERRNELFSRYELIKTQFLWSNNISSYYIENSTETTQILVDRQLIVDFMLQWE